MLIWTIICKKIKLNDETVKVSNIVVEDGKITGIKGIGEGGGADTVIPFNSGGKYTLSGGTLVGHYVSGNSEFTLPLPGAKKISFNWNKSHYAYAYAILCGNDGRRKDLIRYTALGARSSSISYDFGGVEWDYIYFGISMGGNAGAYFSIGSIVVE